jgi:hypothetical protein
MVMMIIMIAVEVIRFGEHTVLQALCLALYVHYLIFKEFWEAGSDVTCIVYMAKLKFNKVK